MNEPATFKRLEVSGWRQFKSVDVELHKNLTVITGANGAGKTTLLRILSLGFEAGDNFLATPTKTENGKYRYFASVIRDFRKFFQLGGQRTLNANSSDIGSIEYTNSIAASRILIPQNNSAQYQLQISPRQQISGIQIRSHRPQSVFKPLSSIPVNSISPQTAYLNYLNELNGKRQGKHSVSTPHLRLKEALVSMAIFGEGNSKISPNVDAQNAFGGFIDVLRKLLPPTLGFQTIDVRTPDLVLVTKSGEFLIDAASGGISSLIDLAFRIHLFSLFNDKFVVTIDEPENHLHPSLQRNLLSRLVEAFPNAQFIVATHSPFMVTSVRDSNVYVLRYENKTIAESNEMGFHNLEAHVVSELLDTKNKAGSADEILREVLGVPSTMPEWVGQEINAIVNRYKNQELSPNVLKQLRLSMSEMGFSEYYVEALSKVTFND